MILVAIVLAFYPGCSKEEIPANNIVVLAAMKTGISIQSTKQLNVCRENIEKESKQGNISSELKKELLEIIQLAEAGKWNVAEKQIVKLQRRYTVDASTVEQKQQDDHSSHQHQH